MVDVQHLNDDIHDLTVENLIAVSDNEIENMVFAVVAERRNILIPFKELLYRKSFFDEKDAKDAIARLQKKYNSPYVRVYCKKCMLDSVQSRYMD